MNNNIICIHKSKVTSASTESTKPISEIIDEIRMPIFQNLVQQIHSAEDSDSKKLKLNLPVFYPTLSSINFLTPTGIIQFDIDANDNLEINLEDLATEIKKLPYIQYAFKSARNGLKFGVLTDFNSTLLDKNDRKKEFIQYYEQTLVILHKDVSIPFIADDSVKSINQACYYSCDPNAYFNEFPQSKSLYEIVKKKQNETIVVKSFDNSKANLQFSPEFVQKLLSYIPKNYSYDRRMPINICICILLGLEHGIKMLQAHWLKKPEELKTQIISQLKSCPDSNIGVLINEAKLYGYLDTTGRARKKLRPKASSLTLTELSSPHEASEKLKATIQDFFFYTKSNTYLSITVGAGKTKEVIEILAKPELSGVNILYLVQNHKLAIQVEKDLNNEINKHKTSFKGFSREKFEYRNSVFRIKGKAQLLSDDSDITMDYFGKSYGSDNVTESCPYTDQYESLANIRIMTHHEWFNKPSKWANGVEYIVEDSYLTPDGDLVEHSSIQPSTNPNYWKPQFIVIDEDIITIDEDFKQTTENNTSQHSSIKNILFELSLGKSIKSVLPSYKNQIFSDNSRNYKSTGSGKYIGKNEKYSEILNSFDEYLLTNDDVWLRGIYYKNDELHINRLKRVHYRYQNVPTLILDATANELIINKVYPNYKFVKIAVKSNANVNVYQMENSNITKSYLEDPKKRKTFVTGLKKKIKDYLNVGLISYKCIPGDDEFIERFASELGVKNFMHFGNLRGSNLFENVDCLLIVGRHALPQNSNRKLTEAIFGFGDYCDIRCYSDKPVRLKDGNVVTLNNSIYINAELQAAYEYASVSETIQGVGRGRIVYGCKKDIFLYSSESLGTDIEITNFFKYENYFENCIIDDTYRNFFESLEEIETSNKNLAKILFEAGYKTSGNIINFVKNNKDDIITEIESYGFERHSVNKKILINRKFN